MKLPIILSKLAILSAVSALLLAMTACSKSSFSKQDYTAQALANQYTHPQIDILVVQDNSSAMQIPFETVQAQLDGFIGALSSWDYHFAVVPLQNYEPLTGKAIIASDCTTIQANAICVPSSSASTFDSYQNDIGWIKNINYAAGNASLGFQYMQENLSDPSMSNTGFLRPGAALAIILLSNSDDITGFVYPADYYYLNGQNGYMLPNDSSADAINSFNAFENFLTGLKGGAGLMKFYSVVAQEYYIASQGCDGQYAWKGNRYMAMSNALNSGSYDVCNNGLSSVLSDIGSSLQNLIQAYEFDYAVLNVTNGSQPIPTSISVTKNGQAVPNDPTNGWTYAGYLTNQPLSYLPQLSNYATGYMIQMNGSAVYSGTDVITVNFQTK